MPGPVTLVCMRDVSCTHDVLHKQEQPALAELCACTEMAQFWNKIYKKKYINMTKFVCYYGKLL